MPSQSTLTADEKAKVKSAIPASSNKIFYATLGRIYYAYPQPDQWSYTGLQGALSFVRDITKNVMSFKMVDLDGTRGVIWEYELYDGFEYHPDRAFFHSFAGDVSPYFILFLPHLDIITGLHDRLRVCK
jgi:Wiskott-Aldrich syndrome protein